MDERLANCVVFLDIKKAFDTVHHEILLRKLEICGFDFPAVKWLRSYLCNRRQVCIVGDAVLSVLSVYINDLNNVSHYAKCKMYADDTSLCMPGRDAVEIEQKIDHNLSSLNNWFIANKLNLNTVKSEFMMTAGSHHLTDPNLRPTLLCRWFSIETCILHTTSRCRNRQQTLLVESHW